MALLDGLLSQTSETDRKSILSRVHPVYKAQSPGWQIGLDAYDGTGGFLTGEYLWQFAREDPDQFMARKAQARYHNYVETLVDIYVRNLTENVTRQSTDAELADWWRDVDGQGTEMSSYLRTALGQALAGGHAGLLVDMTDLPSTGPSRADNPNRVTLSTFCSVDITDWRTDVGGLMAVKLKEAAPTVGFDFDQAIQDPGWLLWDDEQWVRFSAKGELTGVEMHPIGQVPLVMLRPKASRAHPFVGKPLVASSVVRALYNRASEEDLVLRDQALSIFVVEVPETAAADDIDAIEKRLNAGVGTATALVVKGSTEFRTADMTVPKTIRESQAMLVQELYRMAHLRFQRESLDAESAEAIRLQRQDLDQTLRAMSEELVETERQVAVLWGRWSGREIDPQSLEIGYPTEFSLADVEKELTSLDAALTLLKGSDTAATEIRKRALRIRLPDLDDATIRTIERELEAAAEEPDPMAALRVRAAAALGGESVSQAADTEGEAA